MIALFLTGSLLGLSAGISPGPMLLLVLTQTLRHGAREGCKVALTPLLTDAPIIAIALLMASQAARFGVLLGAMSLAGAVFVLYLAYESSRAVAYEPVGDRIEMPGSVLKGILTNLLNPHPWIFWLTVGAAMLAKAMESGWANAGVFLAGFYLLLVGSKVLVALLVARSRHLLGGRSYRWGMRLLALCLAAFGVLLFQEGLKRLHVL